MLGGGVTFFEKKVGSADCHASPIVTSNFDVCHPMA